MKKEHSAPVTDPALPSPQVLVDQRRVRRLSEACYLTYSGISRGAVIVGEGTSVELSAEGLGVESGRSVAPGSLLTICLCLPDGKEPLVIEEVRVTWAQGRRFGVQSVAIGHEERKRLSQYVTRHHARNRKPTASVPDCALPLEQAVA